MLEYDNNDINLRPLANDGFIRLVIKAHDTKENEYVHKAFKGYCEGEAHNNYTLGLQLLMQNLDYVHSINALWDRLDEINSRMDLFEQNSSAEEVEEPKSVGFF